MNSRASPFLQGHQMTWFVRLFFSILLQGFLVSLPQYTHTAHSMWDLSFPTRDQPVPLAVEVWIRNHWTAREVLLQQF